VDACRQRKTKKKRSITDILLQQKHTKTKPLKAQMLNTRFQEESVRSRSSYSTFHHNRQRIHHSSRNRHRKEAGENNRRKSESSRNSRTRPFLKVQKKDKTLVQFLKTGGSSEILFSTNVLKITKNKEASATRERRA
jgi:hypothetical protein